MKRKLYLRDDFIYFETIHTRWQDMDALRHINHAVYLSYMETARLRYCGHFGFGLNRWEASEGFILMAMKVDFIHQTTHPEILEIGQRIQRTGKHSFDILTAIFIVDREEPVVQATFTLAAYNHREKKTTPVPEAVRKAYREFQARMDR
jgi:acyl-CoA thioester hydrolase